MSKSSFEGKISHKSTVQLQIGSFDAAKKVLGIAFVAHVMSVFCRQGMNPHPFTKDLPLMQNEWIILSIVTIYLLFSTWLGPSWMTLKKPKNIKSFTRAYNIFQVIVCSWVCHQVAVYGFFDRYDVFCEPMSYTNAENVRKVSFANYIYFLCKLLDLTDTIIMVLNKKSENITLLHLLHHSNMVIVCYNGAKYIANGHGSSLSMINSAIHVALYLYYLLASYPGLKKYLWWKKYLTMMQLIQFVVIFLHNISFMVKQCDPKNTFPYMSMSYNIIYFWLFMDFYLNVYTKPKSVSSMKNGVQHVKESHVS